MCSHCKLKTKKFRSKDTQQAQMQAIQRIGTFEGWKQMNSWIKVAYKTNNIPKLKTLISQCSQAEISAVLLKTPGIETPKIVKKLTKTAKDPGRKYFFSGDGIPALKL